MVGMNDERIKNRAVFHPENFYHCFFTQRVAGEAVHRFGRYGYEGFGAQQKGSFLDVGADHFKLDSRFYFAFSRQKRTKFLTIPWVSFCALNIPMCPTFGKM